MREFKVGELYKPGITQYIQGTRFDLLESGAFFELYFQRIDSATGILRGIRYVGLPTDFSRKIIINIKYTIVTTLSTLFYFEY